MQSLQRKLNHKENTKAGGPRDTRHIYNKALISSSNDAHRALARNSDCAGGASGWESHTAADTTATGGGVSVGRDSLASRNSDSSVPLGVRLQQLTNAVTAQLGGLQRESKQRPSGHVSEDKGPVCTLQNLACSDVTGLQTQLGFADREAQKQIITG